MTSLRADISGTTSRRNSAPGDDMVWIPGGAFHFAQTVCADTESFSTCGRTIQCRAVEAINWGIGGQLRPDASGDAPPRPQAR
jgi:hypothetical protein